MALDRQTIEKRDFPIGRRGYDPEAVDAHLARLADEVESLKRSGRQRGDTLASTASEQVRMIVEAAEQSAADIEREAELEARRIRQDAREAAEKLRTDAGQQARDHVQRVSENCAAMLERIDTIDGELRGMLESLRGGANRISADLALLQGSVGELRTATGSSFEPESSGGSAGSAPADRPDGDDRPAAAEDAPGGVADGDDDELPADEEGARLIALNMALNGTPREETQQYLAENFTLPDADALLDDVYTRAGQ